MKQVYSFLIFSIICFQGFTQDVEIRARVIDSSNFEPVAFSTIYIDEYTGTITDDQGFFRILLSPGEYADTIHISCIGYQDKGILAKSFDLIRLDSIFLIPGLIELDAVEIQAKEKKTPRKKEIIQLAITHILDNYPDISVLYNGYYREYIKQDDNYINLFESIINIVDPGFQSIDNFTAGLEFKKINTDFPVDSLLMKPYDNINKFVPHSRMPIQLNNELVILRAHDPVRNYKQNSLYFINRLEKDFIKNHNFEDPKLTYLNDRPY